MSTRQHITKTRNYRIYVQQYYEILELHKAKDDKRAFYEVYIRIIPELKNYINTRLQELVHNGHFPHNFYEVHDFIDDLFIAVYENFEDLKQEEDFYLFLFAQIDALLAQAAQEEIKHHESVVQLDLYAKTERDKLRERYTAQFDGDLIMKEELTDVSYDLNKQIFEPIIQDGGTQKLDERIDQEKLEKFTTNNIHEILKMIPLAHRNIATLFIHFHLDAPEIVRITKRSRLEVENSIDSIKHILRRDFFNV